MIFWLKRLPLPVTTGNHWNDALTISAPLAAFFTGSTAGCLLWKGQFTAVCRISHTTHGRNSDPYAAAPVSCDSARRWSLTSGQDRERQTSTIRTDSLGLGEGGLCRAFVSKRCLFSPPQAWKRICLASQVYLYSQKHSSALAQSHGQPGSAYSLLIDWRGTALALTVWQPRVNTTWFLYHVASEL